QSKNDRRLRRQVSWFCSQSKTISSAELDLSTTVKRFMMLLRKFFVIALLCASASLVAYAQTPTPAQRPRLTAFGVEDRYVLHPGDVLDIEYHYTPEFNQTVSIQPDGFISLQMGGDLKVAGRNLEQVRNLILAKVRSRLESPELTVVLKEFQ